MDIKVLPKSPTPDDKAPLPPPAKPEPANDRALCIWHKGCVDGFTSAWIVRQYFNEQNVEFYPGVYQEPPPDCTGRNVIMVDFSYKKDVIEEMRKTARAILIIDHHKTAQEDLSGYHPLASEVTGFPHFPAEGKCHAFFDMDRSGAGLCWDFFFPGEVMPRLVQHVQDRDLWRFKIGGTKEINSLAYSYDFNFATWDLLAQQCENEEGWIQAVNQGTSILRQHMKDCEALIREGRQMMIIGGIEIPMVNAPWFNASEIGNLLSKGPQKCGGTYFDRGDGKRVFSLRSVDGGPDVSAIAKSYGGGGHEHAAGFTAPDQAWRGEPGVADTNLAAIAKLTGDKTDGA